jgi:hypothetical protein
MAEYVFAVRRMPISLIVRKDLEQPPPGEGLERFV